MDHVFRFMIHKSRTSKVLCRAQNIMKKKTRFASEKIDFVYVSVLSPKLNIQMVSKQPTDNSLDYFNTLFSQFAMNKFTTGIV